MLTLPNLPFLRRAPSHPSPFSNIENIYNSQSSKPPLNSSMYKPLFTHTYFTFILLTLSVKLHMQFQILPQEALQNQDIKCL